ncbi:hypothetical protein SteCoe_35216 [Stentor coeruleus]|uniref:Importin subunit alpha n=1 Tax=Stentor coeruleus TaxID=5963 RepID=A0A1R2ASS8_9CILI|nr:hypothetical protein SteCoe_35216 [Stentor coeruleus]
MIYTNERVEMRNAQILKAPVYEKSDTFAVELRKKKRRDEILTKRFHKKEDSSNEYFTNLSIEEMHCMIDQYSTLLCTTSQDLNTVHRILHQFRLFTCMNNAPLLKMISSGIIHYLKDYVSKNTPIELLIESTWIICNLATEAYPLVNELIENDYLEKMIDLIEINNDTIAENCIFFIGNVAGDSIENCEAVLNSDFFKKFEQYFTIKPMQSMNIIKTSLYTFYTISIKNLFIPATAAVTIFNFLSRVKNKINSISMHTEWLKTLCCLVSLTENYGQIFIEKRLLSRTFKYLFFNSIEIQCIVIRILGNMIVCSNRFIDMLNEQNFLDKFLQLITSPNKDIRKEVYWALSNMTAGTPQHVDIFVKHAICKLGLQGLIDNDLEIKINASWLYSNIGRKGIASNIYLLVEMGICEYLEEALHEKNSKIMVNLISLIQFTMISAISEEKPDFFSIFVQTGCYDALITAEYITEKNISSRIRNLLKELNKYYYYE